MGQLFVPIHLANLQACVLEPRIEPAEPGRQQSGATQLAPVFMTQFTKIPRPDVLQRFILDLNIGRPGNEIMDLLFDFGSEVFRQIFRVLQLRPVKQTGFEFSAGPAAAVIHHCPGNVIERVKAPLQLDRVNGDEAKNHAAHSNFLPQVELAENAPVVFDFQVIGMVGLLNMIAERGKDPGRE